eukprot:TRINITY_DN3726_c0_g2_i10.p2 TRINITY_DN3726_c0_g2~~TRINITY_DN3726_c0_g2_i10.p2  ORF type:complete len:205 (+),score=-16.24 TRINITY_DN3726_c0_g2_i10:253-867(+)
MNITIIFKNMFSITLIIYIIKNLLLKIFIKIQIKICLNQHPFVYGLLINLHTLEWVFVFLCQRVVKNYIFKFCDLGKQIVCPLPIPPKLQLGVGPPQPPRFNVRVYINTYKYIHTWCKIRYFQQSCHLVKDPNSQANKLINIKINSFIELQNLVFVILLVYIVKRVKHTIIPYQVFFMKQTQITSTTFTKTFKKTFSYITRSKF